MRPMCMEARPREGRGPWLAPGRMSPPWQRSVTVPAIGRATHSPTPHALADDRHSSAATGGATALHLPPTASDDRLRKYRPSSTGTIDSTVGSQDGGPSEAPGVDDLLGEVPH